MIRFAPHRLEQGGRIRCEILVIGAGAGGSTVAARLAAAGCDVVMVEEGPFITRDKRSSTAPGAFSQQWRNGGLNAAIGASPVAYAEGRCVGGGTEINSAIFQRPADELLDHWGRRYGIEQFSAAALAPYYDRADATVNASRDRRSDIGAHGDKLMQAARAMNWKVSQVERAQSHCVGTNFCVFGCPTGAKQSMTEAVIPGALDAGVRLIAECRIQRLVMKKSRCLGASGVATGHDGRCHEVSFEAEAVFCCAGAINTPALLRRSGIRRNIGNTLRMHPTLKVTAVFDETIDAHLSTLPQFAVTEFLPERRFGGSFFQPAFFALALGEDWERRGHLLREFRQAGTYYVMVRSSGKGRVRALPGLPDPVVTFSLPEAEKTQLASDAALLAEALFAVGAKQVFPGIHGHSGWASASEARLAREGEKLAHSSCDLMTIHLFSSCPPGEDPAVSGTDSYGRVHGLDNVYCADASQIPEAPGVNPQATVMALADRNADAFLSAAR